MINRETIWNETYNRRAVALGRSRIEVFTAIHHYNSELNLCSEMIVLVGDGPALFKAEFDLSAEQMEQLAAHLTEGAERARRFQAMLDEENASIEAAASNAVNSATESA